MKRYITLFAAVACMLAFATTARAPDKEHAADASKDKGNKDHAFVNKAAMSGELEMALGNIAATKASSDDVKKFAQQMVADHSKANEELKTLAQSKNIDLTKANEKAAEAVKKHEEKIAAKEGSDFDKAYTALMVSEHEKDVKLFKKASESAQDSEIKAFAAKTLPTLENHLQMAKELKTKIGS